MVQGEGDAKPSGLGSQQTCASALLWPLTCGKSLPFHALCFYKILAVTLMFWRSFQNRSVRLHIRRFLTHGLWLGFIYLFYHH